MSQRPTVSVVTAVYNQMRFLPRRAESILRQTLADWEWIVVNDASTDGSGAWLDDLAAQEPRIRVLHNPENLHIAHTNQRGIEAAQGEFLYRTDGDDWCHPEFLATMTAELRARPACSFAACRCLLMDERDGLWGGWPRRPDRTIPAQQAFEQNVVAYQFRSPSLVMRTQQVQDVGGFTSLPLRTAHDWNLALRLLKLGDIFEVGRPLAGYRYFEQQFSMQFFANLDVEQLEREHFLPIDDALQATPKEWSLDLEKVRKQAYTEHARRLADNANRLRTEGRSTEAEAIEAVMNRRLAAVQGTLPPQVADSSKTKLLRTIVKRFTYRRLPPVKLP